MYNPVKYHSFGKISQKHCVAGEHQQIVFREVSNAFIVDRLFFPRQRRHRAQFSVDHLGYWNYGNWVPWSLGEVDPIWIFFRWSLLRLKALATIPYFNFHFFPHLLIFLQFRDPSCTKLIHQSSPSEIAYLVQDSQIFAVWINFSPGINKFRRVFLEINHVNLDF